jgi:hypothetical protein
VHLVRCNMSRAVDGASVRGQTVAMALPPARYIVINHDGEWKINLDNTYYGPFETAEAAGEMAVETARKAAEAGYPASVLMMYGNRIETLWASEPKLPGLTS